MDFYAILDQIVDLLRQRQRVTYRALQRQFQLDDAFLEDVKVELIKGQRLAVDEDGEVLVWIGDAGTAPVPISVPAETPGRIAPDVHAALSRRENPDLPECSGRRAQAGDGPLRGCLGVHLALGAARPGRCPQLDESGLRVNAGGGASLRGNGEPVPRRRHHGALRSADCARGSRAARRPCGPGDPPGPGGLSG